MAFLQERNGVHYLYWTQDGRKHGRSLKAKSKSLAEFECHLAARGLGQQTGISLDRLHDEHLSYSESVRSQETFERHMTPRVEQFIAHLKEAGPTGASDIAESHVHRYQEDRLQTLTTSHWPAAADPPGSMDIRPSSTASVS